MRKRLAEELAELEDEADRQSGDASSGFISRLKTQTRRTSADTEAADSDSCRPQSRMAERPKPKEKAAKPKKSREGTEGRKAEAKAETKAEIKAETKEQKKREARMKKLEAEVERLRSSGGSNSLERGSQKSGSQKRSSQKNDNGGQKHGIQENIRPFSRGMAAARMPNVGEREWDSDGGPGIPDVESRITEKADPDGAGLGEMMVKSVVTAAVMIARVMQLVSFFLMAGMVFIMAKSFWEHGQALGDIRLMAAEANYGMALYVGFAGITLFMGLIWCLWIPSKKGAGGGVRMKKYDTGRGFLPFLLCMAAVAAASVILPRIPAGEEAWKGLAAGAAAALEAVNAHRGTLFLSSTAGAVLSLVRKMLRV
ncbi:zinc ribbon domain-containing protein [Hungatella hathewayi]|uniref:zinc ribbon domain-containing protein n=1 Tax=Hungatella hathewayi TaxID=154046 RepID=UPI00210DAAF0|nr:zinc ribbon domain-containing protein [Hungatella hathewayi]MCQ5388273.1 zinc ribbon domain-containing protein [Hungatella hathewayi]